MGQRHGTIGVAWQDVWLSGLRGLKNRDVFALCESDAFKTKFLKDSDAKENAWNCFDPQYQLPDGHRARCILDWERRHLELEAAKNGLKIIYVQPHEWRRQEVSKPSWYQ